MSFTLLVKIMFPLRQNEALTLFKVANEHIKDNMIHFIIIFWYMNVDQTDFLVSVSLFDL